MSNKRYDKRLTIYSSLKVWLTLLYFDLNNVCLMMFWCWIINHGRFHQTGIIHHGQEVVLSEILNVWLECPSEETDMPITAHAHCAPYWKREVSLLLQLPDGCRGARAHSMLLAALIRAWALKWCKDLLKFKGCFFIIIIPVKWTGFLRALTSSKSHEIWQKNQLWWKFTYFIGFASGWGKMAPHHPLDTFKKSLKISGLT